MGIQKIVILSRESHPISNKPKTTQSKLRRTTKLRSKNKKRISLSIDK